MIYTDAVVTMNAVSGTMEIPASKRCTAGEGGCSLTEELNELPRPAVTHFVFNKIGNRKRFIPRIFQLTRLLIEEEEQAPKRGLSAK